jgi:myo-inositol-1-phosphate synthase
MSRKKVRVAIIGVGNCVSSFFKTPPEHIRDDICRVKTEVFIKGEV